MSSSDDGSAPLAATMARQVEAILAQAAQSADAVRREVEEATTRRALDVRQAAETEAARIRARAQAEAEAYLEERHAEVDRLAEDRIVRLRRLTDDLLARGELLVGRVDEAEVLRRGLDDLLRAITAAVQATAAEAARPLGGPSYPKPVVDPSPTGALDLRREMESSVQQPPRP